MRVSPFDTHQRVMSTFLAALFIYNTTSVAEVILRTQKSAHQRLVGNIRLFASALATILLLVTLSLIVSCIISVLWTCLFVKLAYESCQDLCQLLSQTTDDFTLTRGQHVYKVQTCTQSKKKKSLKSHMYPFPW